MSVIIPADAWQNAHGIQQFLKVLDLKTFPLNATPLKLSDTANDSIPQVPEFRESELLEALFLEDAKPVALFDAPSPELIAVRLLSALWPGLRRKFALSTFALSPRKIDGRNFDLVFAPKDARSRFSDWPGRRIDARAGKLARHRWTGEIVNRVFRSPVPWLLDDRDIRLIGEHEGGAPAALRIALLWDELLAKLEQSPSAALGLLDIANSKMQSSSSALLDLQPALISAAERAVANFPASEAWDFLGAMARKMYGTQLAPTLSFVNSAAGVLAGRSPAGAIALLEQADGEGAFSAMVPAIANGLAAHYGKPVEQALAGARLPTFERLIVANPQLARTSLASPNLVERMAEMVTKLKPATFKAFSDEIMPALVDDIHAVLAGPLFASLEIDGVRAEVEHLGAVNQFRARSLLPLLVGRARDLSAIQLLRRTLLSAAPSPGRDEFIAMTLLPVADDVWWLLRQPDEVGADRLLQDVIGQASPQQFRALFGDSSLAPLLLERLAGRRDLLLRAASEGELTLTLRVQTVLRLLLTSSESQKRELATSLLSECLQAHFGNDELATLSKLFAVLGGSLDSHWAVLTGLGRSISGSLINRNIVAFNTAPKPARGRILAAIEDIAEVLASRNPLDLDEAAANACAALLWGSRTVDSMGLLRGAGRLLPTLFQSRLSPVSSIVAATFPFVYRELAKEDEVPDLLKFVPFVDWDRCKTARRQLVEVFLASDAWRPSDLALTACRASDVEKILRRAVKSHRGEAYIARIVADLKNLPDLCRTKVGHTIKLIRSDRLAK